MNVVANPSRLERRPGAGPGYDILVHRLPSRPGLLVVDFVEEHENRGVLLPVCGGPPVYLDASRKPQIEVDFKELFAVVEDEADPVPPPAMTFAERRPRHHAKRRPVIGRVGCDGVTVDPDRAFEFEKLFRRNTGGNDTEAA